MSDDLIKRLNDGIVEHDKRWSGDTHDDLGGSANYEATEAIMSEAAAALSEAQATIAQLEAMLGEAHAMLEYWGEDVSRPSEIAAWRDLMARISAARGRDVMGEEMDQKMREIHAAIDRYNSRVRSANRGFAFLMVAMPLAFILTFTAGLWLFI